MTTTLTDIRAAQSRLAGAIYVSPCPESVALSELTGCKIYCKLDYLQRTGSFKERGARIAAALERGAASERGNRRVGWQSRGSHWRATDGTWAFR